MNRKRLIGILPLAFGAWLFYGMAPYGIHVAEDGDLLYQVFATYRGDVPYVDFSTGYTPGYFYWNALLFHLFGVDVLVMRFSVATANTLTLYFLYSLSARMVSPALALVTPLVFLGSLLAFPGDFVTFNVPYPAWYNITFWLASVAAALSYVDRGRGFQLALAGALAGISFALKPNIGLFNLAALSFFILWWHAPARDAGTLTRWAWWILALATAGGIISVFWSRLYVREFRLFPLPLLTLAGILVAAAQAAPGKPGFLRGAMLLLGGFAVPTLPWLVYFLVRLGPRVFASDVLLIGSPYEMFFYISYRGFGAPWDSGVLLIALALVVVPTAVRRGWIAWWVPLAGAGLGAVALTLFVRLFAPMPDGFQAAVETRVHYLAFFIIQLVNWAGIAVIAMALLRWPQRRSRFFGSLVLVALSATALTLGTYPRSDFMHLLISAPAAMILGTVLLGRLVRRWQAVYSFAPVWRWTVTMILVVPPVLTAAVMASKTVVLATQLYAHYLGAADAPLVHLGLSRASLIMEPGNDRRFSVLRDAARYIEQHTRPNEYVLPFPNLSLLCFLSGRLNPAPKGYFHPGYPDHPAEAEIVTILRRQTPKLAVSLHDHELFLTTAPIYYFLIRDFVQTNFELADRVGPYDMFLRRGTFNPAGTVASIDDSRRLDEAAIRDLDDPNLQVQYDAVLRIRAQRDPRGAAALAQRAVRPDSPYRLLMVRIASHFGDERSVPPLVAIAKRGLNTEVGQEAATALFFIAGKSLLEGYWFAPQAQQARLAAAREQLDREALRAWLRNPRADFRLRFAAAWAAGILDDQEAVPHLLKLQESTEINMSSMAAFSLMKLGRASEAIDTLIGALDHDDTYFPSILIDLYRRDPDTVGAALQAGLVGGTPQQRETLAYLAGVVRDPGLNAALLDLQEDTSPRVRIAAAWALESLQQDGVGIAEAIEPAGDAPVQGAAGSGADPLRTGSSAVSSRQAPVDLDGKID
jgi:HEAT repeat protein